MKHLNKNNAPPSNHKGRPRVKKGPNYYNDDFLKDWDWLFTSMNPSVGTSYGKRGEHSIDERIYYCKTCNRCWQLSTIIQHRSKTEHYEDFPTIGRKRKKCNFCKKREENARTT